MFNNNSKQIEKIIDKELKKIAINFSNFHKEVHKESKLVKKLLKLTK